MKFPTLDDIDPQGKTVLIRVDLNSPIDPETRRVRDNERFRAHAQTVEEVAAKGGKAVVLAHQGRRGEPDFLPLEQHAEILSKYLNRDVRYVPDVIGDAAREAIMGMGEGEVILLDNVRFLEEETREADPETHARSRLVSSLAPLSDVFVLDAFSVSHRSHASIVGFPQVLPTVAGRVMERELKALSEIIEKDREITLFTGGNKPKDCIEVIEALWRSGRLRRLLTAGILGQLFLLSRGHDLGEPSLRYLREKGFMELAGKVKALGEALGDRVLTPIDVACRVDGERVEIDVGDLPAPGLILDIGRRTAELYGGIIRELREDEAVVVKGPAGAYELPEFRLGSRIIYEALRRSRAFTLIGGGDSSTALKMLGMRFEDFSYVSLGGGALIRFLAGKPMPGVAVLLRQVASP